MSKRSKSSHRWLQEHFSDRFVQQAKAEGWRSRAVYKLEEADRSARLFRPGMTVVDVGGNLGLYTVLLAEHVGAAGRVVAFEPDPDNAAVHAQTIAVNSLERRWHLVRAAAGVQDGQAAFLAGDAALSHLVPVDAPRSIEVAVEDVMAILADADLVKMDIEGGEWAILGDDRFRDTPPRVIVLEYHPRLCPSPDPRGLVEATLREAGLTVTPIWHRADGHGMLWAWQS